MGPPTGVQFRLTSSIVGNFVALEATCAGLTSLFIRSTLAPMATNGTTLDATSPEIAAIGQPQAIILMIHGLSKIPGPMIGGTAVD